eukprot:scaffold47292_cov39-Prasinocladus_malaysianus.AAC.1
MSSLSEIAGRAAMRARYTVLIEVLCHTAKTRGRGVRVGAHGVLSGTAGNETIRRPSVEPGRLEATTSGIAGICLKQLSLLAPSKNQ